MCRNLVISLILNSLTSSSKYYITAIPVTSTSLSGPGPPAGPGLGTAVDVPLAVPGAILNHPDHNLIKQLTLETQHH